MQNLKFMHISGFLKKLILEGYRQVFRLLELIGKMLCWKLLKAEDENGMEQ